MLTVFNLHFVDDMINIFPFSCVELNQYRCWTLFLNLKVKCLQTVDDRILGGLRRVCLLQLHNRLFTTSCLESVLHSSDENTPLSLVLPRLSVLRSSLPKRLPTALAVPRSKPSPHLNQYPYSPTQHPPSCPSLHPNTSATSGNPTSSVPPPPSPSHPPSQKSKVKSQNSPFPPPFSPPDKKTVFCTGGAGSICSAQVRALVHLGANACIIGRNTAKTEDMAIDIATARPGARVVGIGGVDVRNADDVKGAADRCAAELGGIDFVM